MKRYCDFCGCEQEFTVYKDDQTVELWGNSHAELWGNSHAELRENSHAVLWENSHAELRENSHAELRENSHAVLWGNSHAVLWGNSHAELRGNSHAVLRGNSHAVLWGNSHAVLWGNSHAVLWENSHAVLRENSHAVLWGNSHAELRGNSHAQCKSPYACAILKEITTKCIGRSVGGNTIQPKDYLKSCGVPMKNQFVILYKSVQENNTAAHDGKTKYIIGKETVAVDWDAKANIECGKGLHLSPSIQQAITFHDSGNYLACRVNIKDIAPLPAFAQYPDKIRVRACIPVYKVDKEGNRIK